MAKEKMTVTLEPGLLADIDADAARVGMNRSEYVQRALRQEHYRQLLDRVGSATPMEAGEENRLRELLSWQRDTGGSRPIAP